MEAVKITSGDLRSNINDIAALAEPFSITLCYRPGVMHLVADPMKRMDACRAIVHYKMRPMDGCISV